MKRSFLSPPKFWCLALLLLLTGKLFAWGVTGHRVVAQIAQDHLSARAKKELAKLIGQESLAWWANWPDFIKSDTAWDYSQHWHYLDLRGSLSRDSFEIALKALPGKNLYTQIPAMVAELKDKTLPIEQRRIALRFLIHLVGDLHQPLHVGHPADQGGNKINVSWFDKTTNLHWVWDNGLVDFQQFSYTEYASQLDIASSDQVKTWQQSSLDDWFYESYQLADKIYAATPDQSKLGYRYNYQFKQVLDQQLLKGGLRLAALLNEALQ